MLGSKYAFSKLEHIDLSTGEVVSIYLSEFLGKLVDDQVYRFTQSPFSVFAPEATYLAVD